MTEEKAEQSTFDVVKVHELHNTRLWTVLCYLGSWIIICLKIAILGADTYTCVTLLRFNRWSSEDVQVYEFKVAKWIFTGCIIFRFTLLAWQIAWAIHIYRTHNIALAYLNNYSALMYKVRSYDYHCLFHAIEMHGFFEWAGFFIYFNLDDALEVMVADLPRQVINILTLRQYATDGSSNVLENIKKIATTNVRLSVVLSLQLLSVVIFAFFFFRFVLAMLLFIPIKVKVSDKGFRLFKAFCYLRVNEKVRLLVSHNHKSKHQLLAEGIMDADEIKANPLLASSSTFDLGHSTYNLSSYGQLAMLLDDLLRSRPPRTYASSLRYGNRPFTRPDRLGSASSLAEYPENFTSPFSDLGRYESNPLLATYENPFADSALLVSDPFVDKLKALGTEVTREVDELEEEGNAWGARETDTWDDRGLKARERETRRKKPRDRWSPEGNPQEKKVNLALQSGGHANVAPLELAQSVQPDDVTSPLLEQSPHNETMTPYPARGVSRYFEDDH